MKSKFLTLLITGVLALGLLAQPVAAADSARLSQLAWNWDPWILTLLTVAALGYIRGLSRMNKTVRSRIFGWVRCAAFAAGVATLFGSADFTARRA